MSNGNVTPIRPPALVAASPQQVPPPPNVNPQWWGGAVPDGGGWVWNGTDWIWVWGGAPTQPCPPPPPQGWCPPQPCPPCGPMPQPPSCFSAVSKAQACYDQSQALYNLVSQVVMDIFTKNPGIIPSPPATAGSGPIKGSTDGSAAAPGEVGEYLHGMATYAYPVGPAGGGSVSTSLIPLTVPAGDWMIWCSGSSGYVSGWTFVQTPVPAGMVQILQGSLATGAQAVDLAGALWAGPVQGIFTAPTPITFGVTIYSQSTLPAGEFDLDCYALRVR